MHQSLSKNIFTVSLFLLIAGCGGGSGSGGTSHDPVTYYLDCSATSNGSGSLSSPWNSVNAASTHTFHGGDRLLLRRSTACSGALTPAGSGSQAAPIVVDAYDAGAPPILNGGAATAALALSNQSHWTIQNIEIVGGVTYGIRITTAGGQSIRGITLKNLDVHSASGAAAVRNDSGEVSLSVTGPGESISDVLIDGVTAHDSQVSEGIVVSAGDWSSPTGVKGSNIVIQNSFAYNVGGDGILLMGAADSVMRRNGVHHTGLCTVCTGSTPVGLWVWNSRNVLIEYNESYANSSWGVDGGGFDIDFWNEQITLQYNYAHDNHGYCLAIFGAENSATRDSVVRYNVCSNNMQAPGYTGERGEIVVYTWNGGSIDGLRIYNNTLSSHPVLNGAVASLSQSTYSGSGARLFKNNLIYTAVTQPMIDAASGLQLDNNIYFSATGTTSWIYNGTTYASFGAYQTASSQDAQSSTADPQLNDPTYHGFVLNSTAFTLAPASPAIDAGTDTCSAPPTCENVTQDILAAPVPLDEAFDIGASEYVASAYLVEPIIFVPTDYAQYFEDDAIVAFYQAKVAEAQQFFRTHNNGKTFQAKRVALVRVQHDHSWYRQQNNGNFEYGVLLELQNRGYPVHVDWNLFPSNRVAWVLAMGGGGYAGGRHYPTGGGFAMWGDAVLFAGMDLNCDRVVSAYENDGIVETCRNAWLPGGKIYGFGVGAAIHELGHALNLPHPADGSPDWNNTVMGYHWNYPNTGLSSDDRTILASSPFLH